MKRGYQLIKASLRETVFLRRTFDRVNANFTKGRRCAEKLRKNRMAYPYLTEWIISNLDEVALFEIL
jgi:hypothetical protein